MIRSTAVFMLVFLSAALFAQAPPIMWTKIFGVVGQGDDGESVQQTADGGYIIVGVTGADVWLIKTDANGDSLWSKTFGGDSSDVGYSVQQATDGGYIIAGSTSSFGAGNSDVWLIKTDTNGDMLWSKTFGGSDSDVGNSVNLTPDGGYIIAGSTSSFGAGNSDVWLIKTDANGNTLWTKTFGGSDSDVGNSVNLTSDGGYIIAGTTSSFGAGNSDVWLIKTDANGNTLWTKTFGGSDSDVGNSVNLTSDGGYIIAGTTSSFGHGHSDVWLVKTDAAGYTLWTNTYGDSFYDRGNSVDTTSDGGYIITGGFDFLGAIVSDVWLIKTDAAGDTLWTKIITESGNILRDEGLSVQQTTDGGYIISGYYLDLSGVSSSVWLIKVAPDVTSIEEKPRTSLKDYRLHQNYPNPFNPTTTIDFSLPQSGFVTLKVYSILGEEVATLVSKKLAVGKYKFDWDASILASGVYIYRIQAGDYVESKKMILLR